MFQVSVRRQKFTGEIFNGETFSDKIRKSLGIELLVKQKKKLEALTITELRGVYDGQDVAVKLLDWGEEGHTSEAEIVSLKADFAQEVAVWHKLDHPNVTKFIGATMGASCGALKSFLIKNRRRKLAFSVVVQLALDLARGLSHLHS
ncbi:Serine-threonine/tyrosine-protein kinase catalytic domain protein [Raphanus sativus]|nr:Serine-threonine/tyrosine-protein kinase catalytic domain protein [Raphanus sativus]